MLTDNHCRSLHWERGLKHLLVDFILQENYSRSLHWERGLKQKTAEAYRKDNWSLPSLGAWIETFL